MKVGVERYDRLTLAERPVGDLVVARFGQAHLAGVLGHEPTPSQLLRRVSG